jgi:hypothetical protein
MCAGRADSAKACADACRRISGPVRDQERSPPEHLRLRRVPSTAEESRCGARTGGRQDGSRRHCTSSGALPIHDRWRTLRGRGTHPTWSQEDERGAVPVPRRPPRNSSGPLSRAPSNTPGQSMGARCPPWPSSTRRQQSPSRRKGSPRVKPKGGARRPLQTPAGAHAPRTRRRAENTKKASSAGVDPHGEATLANGYRPNLSRPNTDSLRSTRPARQGVAWPAPRRADGFALGGRR